MARISFDNGNTFMTAAEALNKIIDCDLWDAVVAKMYFHVLYLVVRELAPCTRYEFLNRYLEIASDDLIIG